MDKDPPPARRFPEIERRVASTGALDLEPLMTVCPKCGARFRVTETQLQAARGRVRCGACGSIFDGVDQLVLDTPREFASSYDAERALDELMAELLTDSRVVPPPQAGEPEPAAGHPAEEDSGAGPDARPAPGPGSPCAPGAEMDALSGDGPGLQALPAPAATPATQEPTALELAEPPAVEPPAAAAPVVAEAAAPAVVEPPPPAAAAVVFGVPRRRRRPWVWALLLVSALAVAAQVLWLRFDVWVRDPAWRPVYAALCPWFGCELPVRRALDRVRAELIVDRSDEGTGTMVLRVLIVNQADFPQPFPVLELRFSELNGALVAGHRFQPRDYLAGDARDLESMPVATPVQLELRIPDPGPRAVNYELKLR